MLVDSSHFDMDNSVEFRESPEGGTGRVSFRNMSTNQDNVQQRPGQRQPSNRVAQAGEGNKISLLEI